MTIATLMTLSEIVGALVIIKRRPTTITVRVETVRASEALAVVLEAAPRGALWRRRKIARADRRGDGSRRRRARSPHTSANAIIVAAEIVNSPHPTMNVTTTAWKRHARGDLGLG